jgi:hypothetical protein
MDLVKTGEDLPARQTGGVFRERDLAAWRHGDPAARADTAQRSVLRKRWDEMANEVSSGGTESPGA